jgi:hypothetical protein
MRRIVLLTALVLLGAAAATACGPFKSPPPQFPNVEARFLANCSFSHRLADDPIVFPNQAGASHSHDFLGNTTTNAATTAGSMLAGGTTCQPTNDKTGYWVPTLYVSGSPQPPVFANFYYRGNKRDFQNVQPFPPGFKMIAGTAMATSPQPTWVTTWGCTDGSGIGSEIPTCPAGERLKMNLFFPDCWDGVNLDSGDHKSHLSYRVNGRCPASHPAPVPQIQFFIVYNTTGGPTSNLACGSQYCMHGDFFNGWDQSVLQSRVANCINAGIKCNKNGFPE